MTDVIDFLFTVLNSLWVVIVTHWILAFGVLLLVLSSIVDLVKSSSQQK